jgi:uncharacterized protein (TIGR00304 family)
MYLGGSENMKMNRFLAIAIMLLIGGIALLGFSVAEGESSAGLFVIFPVLIGSGIWAFLGMMCIMGALIFGFMGIGARFAGFGDFDESEPRDQQRQGQGQGQGQKRRTSPAVKGGGVVLIGPIPIIFGSDTRLTIVLVILAIIMMFAMMFFFFYMM